MLQKLLKNFRPKPFLRRRTRIPQVEVLEDRTLLATIVVTEFNDESDGPQNGISLREAIQLASDGDTIEFGPDTACFPLQLTLGGIQINKSLTFNGGASNGSCTGTRTRIELIGDGRVILIDDGDAGQDIQVVFNDMVVAGGSTSQSGAGIYNKESLTMTNTYVMENHSEGLGGGIRNTGSMTLIESVVTQNSSTESGGGISNGGELTLIKSTIDKNSSGWSGGGVSNGGTLKATQSTISLNTVNGFGGGIDSSGMARLMQCTISGNTAFYSGGGAINANDSTMEFINCTITGNRSDSEDNGIGDGGGLYTYGFETVHNTIIAGNFKGSGSDAVPDDVGSFGGLEDVQHSLIGDASSAENIVHGVSGNIVGNDGVGTLDIETVLDPTLQDNGGPTQTHKLIAGSPAIDAGDQSLLPEDADDVDGDGITSEGFPVDQRGSEFERVLNGQVDMGSVESLATEIVVTTLLDEDDGVNNGTGISFREALRAIADGGVITFAVDGIIDMAPGALQVRPSTIDGTGQNVVLQGATLRVFDGEFSKKSQTWIRNLTIQGARGALTNSESLTIDNVTIQDNQSHLNGRGGGIDNSGTLTVLNSTIANNSAYYGGGIHNDGNMTIENSSIVGNTAQRLGGGIHSEFGLLNIEGSTISGNSALERGGGIYSFDVLISNATISGNTAQDLGGGIFASGSLMASNLTVVNNRADGDYQGLGAGGGITSGWASLFNSIVAGNVTGDAGTPNDMLVLEYEMFHNLIGDAATSSGVVHGVNGNIVGINGQGTIALDSVLDPVLRNNGGATLTHALVVGSPAINAGDNAWAKEIRHGNDLVYDQRGVGFDRIHVGTVDIGAYESPFVAPSIGNSDIIGRWNGHWWVAESDGQSALVNDYYGDWGNLLWQDSVAGDFNGDGVTDVASRSGMDWYVGISDGDSFSKVLWGSWSASYTEVQIADVNGDGLSDIIGRDAAGGWNVLRSNGSDFVSEYWHGSVGTDLTDVRVGDVDGDGDSDIVGRDSTGTIIVAKSNGVDGFAVETWGYWVPGAGWQDVNLGDVNGDGNDDLIGRTANGKWWVAVSDGTKFTNQLWGAWAPQAGWQDVLVGDFNADGNDDIAGRASYGGWWVALSNGTHGFTNAPWGGWSSSVTWLDVQVVDVNHDGADDIAGRIDGQGAWWVAKSTTTSFSTERWGGWANVTWQDVMSGTYVNRNTLAISGLNLLNLEEQDQQFFT